MAYGKDVYAWTESSIFYEKVKLRMTAADVRQLFSRNMSGLAIVLLD